MKQLEVIEQHAGPFPRESRRKKHQFAFLRLWSFWESLETDLYEHLLRFILSSDSPAEICAFRCV